jgi:hypothetical protein
MFLCTQLCTVGVSICIAPNNRLANDWLLRARWRLWKSHTSPCYSSLSTKIFQVSSKLSKMVGGRGRLTSCWVWKQIDLFEEKCKWMYGRSAHEWCLVSATLGIQTLIYLLKVCYCWESIVSIWLTFMLFCGGDPLMSTVPVSPDSRAV